MPSDVEKASGNYGRFRGILSQTSQNASANTTTLRIRGILYNDGTSASYNSNTACSISGAYSWSGTENMSVAAKGSQTIIDESFTVTHDSNGNRANVSVTINIANTDTYTFGDPPAITVDLTPTRIPKVPEAPGSMANALTLPSSVKFTWGAPDNMGSAILEYQLQYDDISNFSSPATVSTGTARDRTLSLGIGKTWYGRSRARNAVGWGPYSAASSRVIPNVPNTPARPSLTFRAPQELSASWVAPGNNGATITNYVVEYTTDSSFGSGVTSKSTGTTTSLSITGLAMDKTWYVRVYATNSQGNSGKSASTSYAIPTKPGAPGTPTLTISPPTTLSVSWTAPSNNGGAAVTKYTVEWATNSAFTGASTKDVTTLSTTLTGLNPGSTYHVRVYAINSQGTSSAGGSSLQLMYAGPRVNVSGVYKNTVAYVNVGGVWKVAVPYVNVGGVWKIAGG